MPVMHLLKILPADLFKFLLGSCYDSLTEVAQDDKDRE